MKNYFLKPSGSEKFGYVEYLLNRLTSFRKAGTSFGQKHQGQVNIHVTRKIVQSQLGWPLNDETYFEQTCEHIKAKIDDTILGRRNAERGTASYHPFAEHGKPKAKAPKKPASAPMRAAIGSEPLNQPSCAGADLPRTESQAGKISLAGRLPAKTAANILPHPLRAGNGRSKELGTKFKVATAELPGDSSAGAESVPLISAGATFEFAPNAVAHPANAKNGQPHETSGPQKPGFTASQIAAELRITRQAVQNLLGDTPASGQTIVAGNVTKTWTVASLPSSLIDRLKTAVKAKHCRDIEHLLSAPCGTWQPPVPLAGCAQPAIDKAAKLCRALELSIAKRNELSAGEIEAIGLRDYRAVFGHEISAAHWRRLFARTLERMGATGDPRAMEFYLDESPARKTKHTTVLPAENDFRELHEAIQAFADPAKPTSREIDFLWLRAVELFAALSEDANAKKIKNRLLKFLWRHAPWLATSQEALRVNFKRKHSRWLENDGDANALLDGRELKRGQPKKPTYPEHDTQGITWLAVNKYRGRLAPALREWLDDDECSPEFLAAISRQPRSKSYVPRRLRERLTPDIEVLLPHHQGPRAADKVKPSLDLNYDGIHSMRCVTADDFTFNSYFYVPDGQGWFRLTRGQAILVMDFRTLRVLGFGLSDQEQPNSLLARSIFYRVFDEHGLPEILYLERGKVFQDAKLITGGIKTRKALRGGAVSDADLEMGLRQYGIKFIHARRARSKPIERVGGLLQDMMNGEPGYAGRDERRDRPERLTQQMRAVERREVHPSEFFYNQDQWLERLAQIIESYNTTPQEGKRLKGLSPDGAFQKLWKHEEVSRFDANCRYLLAHHRIPIRKVTTNGISFSVGGKQFTYRDEQTGRCIGRELIGWFNPELPECCTFTDPKMRNAFTVIRSNSVNALNVDDSHAMEVAKVESHASYGRNLYRVLKSKFKPSFRPNIVAQNTIALGQKITEQRAALVTEQREESSLHRRGEKLLRELGMEQGRRTFDLSNPAVVDSLEQMAEAMRGNEQEAT